MIAQVVTLLTPLPLGALAAGWHARRRRLLDRLLREWRGRLWPVLPPVGVA